MGQNIHFYLTLNLPAVVARGPPAQFLQPRGQSCLALPCRASALSACARGLLARLDATRRFFLQARVPCTLPARAHFLPRMTCPQESPIALSIRHFQRAWRCHHIHRRHAVDVIGFFLYARALCTLPAGILLPA